MSKSSAITKLSWIKTKNTCLFRSIALLENIHSKAIDKDSEISALNIIFRL